MQRFFIILFLFCSCRGKKSNESRFVGDFASLLSDREFRSVDSIINSIRQRSSCEFEVLSSTEPLNTQQAKVNSSKLFNKVALGQKCLNNGVLLSIYQKSKIFDMRVGYGLEWILNENYKDSIIRRVNSYFMEEKYFQGILTAISMIYDKIKIINWQIKNEGDLVLYSVNKIQLTKFTLTNSTIYSEDQNKNLWEIVLMKDMLNLYQFKKGIKLCCVITAIHPKHIKAQLIGVDS